jgi:hypothetical protein
MWRAVGRSQVNDLPCTISGGATSDRVRCLNLDYHATERVPLTAPP